MIKRYDIWPEGSDVAYLEVEECEDGEWVKFEDYEKLAELLAENAVFCSDLMMDDQPIRAKKLRERAERVLGLIE